MFRKAEGRHARAFQADGRAINEKVRLYARVGAAVISAHDNEQDAFGAITAAHCYRFPARIARHKLAAVDAVPEAVRVIAWKAQTRLCQRYRRMMAKGKP